MSARRSALSTGQAAKCCFVTADTVANWIRSGILPAQRTAGGQYRILERDLRAFMVARGMSTDALAPERGSRLPCWEFRAARDPDSATRCEECIVRYLKALDCFKLMAMRPDESGPCRHCAECEYFRRYGEEPEES